MITFDAQEISLLIMATQRYKSLQERKLKEYTYSESDTLDRKNRIEQLENLEEKLFDWLDRLEKT